TSVRARRQRDSLAIRAAARVQTDDALKRHVEQISVRPLGTDRVEHAIGELHHLLLGIREHRNVRVTHRAANRHPLAIDPAPSVEARLTLRVKLGESDPAAKLSLSRALAPRKPHTTVTTAPLKLVTLRIDLVSLPNRRALLVIQHSRLTLEGARAKHRPLLDQVADRAAKRRPGFAVDQVVVGNDEGRHSALSVARGSPFGLDASARRVSRFSPLAFASSARS